VIWRASALILAAGLVLGCTKPGPAPAESAPAEEKPAEPPKVKTVSPTRQYWGEVGAREPAGVAPKSRLVTNQTDFEKIWKAWWRVGKTPEVDFTTSFVVVSVWIPGQVLLQGVTTQRPSKGTDGVKITALKVLPDGSALPVLKANISDDEKWTETKGFYWGISVFPRAGITSVNDTPLPPP
jgi:hypothetical protein